MLKPRPKTVKPRASVPPKPPQQTPKNLADGGHAPAAKAEGSMDAICSAMLDHVLAFMAAKDAVRATVLQAFASAASADFGMAKKNCV
jgi:hypothetical protein